MRIGSSARRKTAFTINMVVIAFLFLLFLFYNCDPTISEREFCQQENIAITWDGVCNAYSCNNYEIGTKEKTDCDNSRALRCYLEYKEAKCPEKSNKPGSQILKHPKEFLTE